MGMIGLALVARFVRDPRTYETVVVVVVVVVIAVAAVAGLGRAGKTSSFARMAAGPAPGPRRCRSRPTATRHGSDGASDQHAHRDTQDQGERGIAGRHHAAGDEHRRLQPVHAERID